MRVLVTGGAGFIGSHVVEYFQHRAEVRVLDNLRTGHRHNLAGLNCEFIPGSVLDRDLVRRAVQGVDYLFHLAAMVSVPESMEQPIACVEINTLGTLVLMEEAARAGVRKLIFSSSAAVYGDNPAVPKHEAMTPEPRSPYAATKFDGEIYAGIFTDTDRLPTACLRYFNVFGPRQDPLSPYAAAVPHFIARALHGEPLTIFGDGEQTRDFIYVQDVVAANVFFATTADVTGVFNVAGGRRISINELARTIIRLCGSASAVRHAAPRPGDVQHSLASLDKLRAAGFAPAHDLPGGLQTTLAFYRQPPPAA